MKILGNNKYNLLNILFVILFIFLAGIIIKYCQRERIKTEAPKEVKKVLEQDNIKSDKEAVYRAYIDSIIDSHRITLAKKDNAIQALQATKNKVLKEYIKVPSLETAKPVIIIQDSLYNLAQEYIAKQDTLINNQDSLISSYKSELAQKNLTIQELTFIYEKTQARLEKAVRPKRFGMFVGAIIGLDGKPKPGGGIGIPLATF